MQKNRYIGPTLLFLADTDNLAGGKTLSKRTEAIKNSGNDEATPINISRVQTKAENTTPKITADNAEKIISLIER